MLKKNRFQLLYLCLIYYVLMSHKIYIYIYKVTSVHYFKVERFSWGLLILIQMRNKIANIKTFPTRRRTFFNKSLIWSLSSKLAAFRSSFFWTRVINWFDSLIIFSISSFATSPVKEVDYSLYPTRVHFGEQIVYIFLPFNFESKRYYDFTFQVQFKKKFVFVSEFL